MCTVIFSSFDYNRAMKQKDFIPAFNYDFLTPFYDFLTNLLGFGYKEREKIVNLLQLKNSEKLLDVGCGTGTLVIVAKDLHPKNDIIGIDIDQNILRIAQSKTNEKELKIKFINASADKLPFDTSTFDVVVSTLIFHHLPLSVKKGAIKEIKRVLKNNGRFLLVDFGKADGLLLKLLYNLEVWLHIKEAETLKDNVEGVICALLKQEGFKVRYVASKKYNAIEYILATK